MIKIENGDVMMKHMGTWDEILDYLAFSLLAVSYFQFSEIYWV